jgi:hypothetical protein
MGNGFEFQPLGPNHDRAAFSCGEMSLDDYLKTKARKEHDLGYSAVFILSPLDNPNFVAGYYTLSNISLELSGIPEASRKGFPRYPVVPATLLGRLARSLVYKGTDLGEHLLLNALDRACRAAESAGSHAVAVDPLSEKAADFYRKYGFINLVGQTQRQYLPMATIKKLGL